MWIYRLLTTFLYFLAYPVGRWRAAQGREIWRGRLGLIPDVGPKDIWFHAASAGETKIVSYLVDYLARQRPGLQMHVTVMTRAGFGVAARLLSAEVTLSYFPLDARPVIVKTLERIQPRIMVIAETEIWPNLISIAADRRIPVILINGRMSTSAFKRYRLIKGFMTRLLTAYDHFFLKSEQDQRRFASFGVDDDKTTIAGDMKFDAPLADRSRGRRDELRFRAGVEENEFLVVAGSTRSGEERQLLTTYRSLKVRYPGLRLLLAPRHIERADEIESLLDELKEPYHIYGADRVPGGVVLVNEMGVLTELYTAAEVAFVGGTLVDIGGHNLLEPVWAGTPVLFGPHLDNVKEAASFIMDNNYGAMVQSADEFGRVLKDMLGGRLSFQRKSEADHQLSATSTAGDYILRKLKHV